MFSQKLKTPNQIKELLKKHKIEFDISEMFTKESSGATLARADDPRDVFEPNIFPDGDEK